MATKYFRVTAYHPAEDISAIIDSNGMFDKLWEFSSYLLQKGFKILEVSGDDKFIDVNIDRAEASTDKFFLRAYTKGMPSTIAYELDGKQHAVIKVGDKLYIPDKSSALFIAKIKEDKKNFL